MSKNIIYNLIISIINYSILFLRSPGNVLPEIALPHYDLRERMGEYVVLIISPNSVCSDYSFITMMHTFLDSDVGSGTSGYVRFFIPRTGQSELSSRCDSMYGILEEPQPMFGTEANGMLFCLKPLLLYSCVDIREFGRLSTYLWH